MKDIKNNRSAENFANMDRYGEIERLHESVDRTLSDVQKSFRGSNKKKKKKQKKKKQQKKYKKRFKKGFKKGFKIGFERGEMHKAEEVARILLIRGFSPEVIGKATGLAKETIDELNVIE